MPHPFDNPYAEPDPVAIIPGLPSFDQFVAWVRLNDMARSYSLAQLGAFYNMQYFQNSREWSQARREMLELDV